MPSRIEKERSDAYTSQYRTTWFVKSGVHAADQAVTRKPQTEFAEGVTDQRRRGECNNAAGIVVSPMSAHGFRRNRNPPRRAHETLCRHRRKVSEWVTYFPKYV